MLVNSAVIKVFPNTLIDLITVSGISSANLRVWFCLRCLLWGWCHIQLHVKHVSMASTLEEICVLHTGGLHRIFNY